MSNSTHQLHGKTRIYGYIVLRTGLHVGGSKADLDIGGIELNVVKNPGGIPFIPGSSLKGKLRSLLAKIDGSLAVKDDLVETKRIFGVSADEQDTWRGGPTRLLVRDARLDETHFEKEFDEWRSEMETPFTVAKYENSIKRETGAAENPRQIERVPAGARFEFELIYNEYNSSEKVADLTRICSAMKLLENDYLGGQGSRGYGQIEFFKSDSEKGWNEEAILPDVFKKLKPEPTTQPEPENATAD